MFGQSDDDFLIASEAAAKLRIAKRTLDNHRWKGTGPKFRRHGGRIVYRHSDLLAWSEERAARLAAQKPSHNGYAQPAHNSDSRHRVGSIDRPKQSVPKLYWNTTPSVPTGLYTLTSRIPAKGDLAIISLPEATAALADARGYLPARSRLIKPVVAGSGDTVCRHGLVVRIDGRPLALADELDMRQRPLPQWDGCHRLTPSEIFVISTCTRQLRQSLLRAHPCAARVGNSRTHLDTLAGLQARQRGIDFSDRLYKLRTQ